LNFLDRFSKNIQISNYCECVFVALGIQHAMRMRHIFICALSGSTIFFHINKRHHFRKKTPLNKKMCILIFCTTFVTNMSHYKKNSARCDKKHITSSVYDCTVEDVEYHNVAIVTHIRHLVCGTVTLWRHRICLQTPHQTKP